MTDLFSQVDTASGAFEAYIFKVEKEIDSEASEYLDFDDGGDGES
jgi:hypothetical protein